MIEELLFVSLDDPFVVVVVDALCSSLVNSVSAMIQEPSVITERSVLSYYTHYTHYIAVVFSSQPRKTQKAQNVKVPGNRNSPILFFLFAFASFAHSGTLSSTNEYLILNFFQIFFLLSFSSQKEMEIVHSAK